MSRTKLFIIIGVSINLLLFGGLFINKMLTTATENFDKMAMLYDLVEQVEQQQSGTNQPIGSNNVAGTNTGNKNNPSSTGILSSNSAELPPLENMTEAEKEQAVQQINESVQKPVEKKDMLSAGAILMKRLSMQEINWLYKVGNSPKKDPEEVKKAKELLQSRLTPEDLEALKEMGSKYGKNISL